LAQAVLREETTTTMIISTMNDLPGYEIEEVQAKGANPIVAFRFDTSELGTTWTEICAYGTAVRATRR
jgi:Putative heavy-metal-binding